MVKTIIMVVYVIICIALTIIVLSQEGKSASLTSSIMIIHTGARIKEVQKMRFSERSQQCLVFFL